MNLDLDEKIAIVTGGASNIGRAISIDLAKEGANVIVADLDAEQGHHIRLCKPTIFRRSHLPAMQCYRHKER